MIKHYKWVYKIKSSFIKSLNNFKNSSKTNLKLDKDMKNQPQKTTTPPQQKNANHLKTVEKGILVMYSFNLKSRFNSS